MDYGESIRRICRIGPFKKWARHVRNIKNDIPLKILAHHPSQYFDSDSRGAVKTYVFVILEMDGGSPIVPMPKQAEDHTCQLNYL